MQSHKEYKCLYQISFFKRLKNFKNAHQFLIRFGWLSIFEPFYLNSYSELLEHMKTRMRLVTNVNLIHCQMESTRCRLNEIQKNIEKFCAKAELYKLFIDVTECSEMDLQARGCFKWVIVFSFFFFFCIVFQECAFLRPCGFGLILVQFATQHTQQFSVD